MDYIDSVISAGSVQIDLLQTTRIGQGIVSGRVALLLQSAEIKPSMS